MNVTLRSAGLLVAALAIASMAFAGTLTMGAPVIQGDQITIPVILDGSAEEGVASLDFRLRYDASVLEPLTVRTGQAAAAADKQVHANSPQPGEYAVLMMGLNTNTVQSGEVASIVMQRVDNGATGRTHLTITRTTLSSAQGSEIPSSGSQQTLELGQPGETGEQPAEQPATAEPGQTPDPANTDNTNPNVNADSTATPDRPAERGAGATGTNSAMASNPAQRPAAAPSKPGAPTAGQAGGGENIQTARLSPRQALQQAQNLRPELPTPGAAGAQGAGAGQVSGAPAAGQTGVAGAPSGGAAVSTEAGGRARTAPVLGGAPVSEETRMADAAQAAAGAVDSATAGAAKPAHASGAAAAETTPQGSIVKYAVMGAFVVIIVGFFALRQKLFS